MKIRSIERDDKGWKVVLDVDGDTVEDGVTLIEDGLRSRAGGLYDRIGWEAMDRLRKLYEALADITRAGE